MAGQFTRDQGCGGAAAKPVILARCDTDDGDGLLRGLPAVILDLPGPGTQGILRGFKRGDLIQHDGIDEHGLSCSMVSIMIIKTG
jgi:hypothetical protein